MNKYRRLNEYEAAISLIVKEMMAAV